MIERNFTEVVPGWYRTRDGRHAEVVQILSARLHDDHPARGVVGIFLEAWSITGRASSDWNKTNHLDLITYLGTEKPREKPREKKTVTRAVTRWVNVYDGYIENTFTTKEHADANGYGRIACVELTGEYGVEEDE